MATKKPFVKLVCEVCKNINYYTHKSLKMGDNKLGLKKYCNHCKKHTLHKEGKK